MSVIITKNLIDILPAIKEIKLKEAMRMRTTSFNAFFSITSVI